MSRVGKNVIKIPDSVEVGIAGLAVTAKGKLGELSTELNEDIEILHEDDCLFIKPKNHTATAKSMWGTTRSLVNNLIVGVDKGFRKELEITGVGYRAQVQGKNLILALGFSHEVKYPIPETVDIKCSDQNHITIEGVDKQVVGQVAAEIRKFRPPEPYKGKGVRYADEYVVRKEGKKK